VRVGRAGHSSDSRQSTTLLPSPRSTPGRCQLDPGHPRALAPTMQHLPHTPDGSKPDGKAINIKVTDDNKLCWRQLLPSALLLAVA
jgi:hypothetical protein